MPKSSPTIITHASLETLSGKARGVARLRANLNVHPRLDDPIQRLFNAMEPGTYVRPHRHARESGWELMMCMKGAFSILMFDDSGTLTQRVDLDSANGNLAVEIPPFTWHAVVSHRQDTVMFEVKPGPYTALDDKDFAPWAPPECDGATERFRLWYAVARQGETPPIWNPEFNA
jgi:cupin fold WbuC family metalloprotein